MLPRNVISLYSYDLHTRKNSRLFSDFNSGISLNRCYGNISPNIKVSQRKIFALASGAEGDVLCELILDGSDKVRRIATIQNARIPVCGIFVDPTSSRIGYVVYRDSGVFLDVFQINSGELSMRYDLDKSMGPCDVGCYGWFQSDNQIQCSFSGGEPPNPKCKEGTYTIDETKGDSPPLPLSIPNARGSEMISNGDYLDDDPNGH